MQKFMSSGHRFKILCHNFFSHIFGVITCVMDIYNKLTKIQNDSCTRSDIESERSPRPKKINRTAKGKTHASCSIPKKAWA